MPSECVRTNMFSGRTDELLHVIIRSENEFGCKEARELQGGRVRFCTVLFCTVLYRTVPYLTARLGTRSLAPAVEGVDLTDLPSEHPRGLKVWRDRVGLGWYHGGFGQVGSGSSH